jgi:outer membrane protein OmpA-like peptidoglycan-associated protein
VIGRPRSSEEGVRVPLWIVTFSDMTTNLLTFFVLLLSLGQIRDDTLFDDGHRISYFFLQSVKAAFGVRDATDFDYAKIKHQIEKPEQPKGTTIDARAEQARRLFKTLRRSMQTLKSQITAGQVDFEVANVSFAPGQTDLDDAGRQWLSRFCLDLQQNTDPDRTVLYVVALAGAEATEAEQWLLSARRAQVVADFLRQASREPAVARTTTNMDVHSCPWRILWWGAGPGDNWAGQDRLDPGQSRVLIAVLKTGD